MTIPVLEMLKQYRRTSILADTIFIRMYL